MSRIDQIGQNGNDGDHYWEDAKEKILNGGVLSGADLLLHLQGRTVKIIKMDKFLGCIDTETEELFILYEVKEDV